MADGSYIVFDEAALDELFSSTNGPAGKHLKKLALRVQRGAKRRSPVDTGRLRASIAEEMGSDSRGLVARIGTNVVYARHVEFGTVRMRAQPFLRPALDDAR
jgi:HK97 gp10 family phage protein